MVKLIIVAAVAFIAGLLTFASTKPDTFRIQRSLSIKTPPDKIFSLINSFREWEAWSPWEKVDPAIMRTYSGEPQGTGAVYEWSGNEEIGQGRMEIVESAPPSLIIIQIDFTKPLEAHNTIEFILDAQGDTTTVTQAMHGKNSYLAKIMGLVFNTDKMIGQKFEEGLASLKAIAEK